MNLDTLFETHRVATTADTERLSGLSKEDPGQIIVRDLLHDQFYPFSDFAVGPFEFGTAKEFGKKDDCPVLAGIEKETGKGALLRIVDGGVVELVTDRFPQWTAPAMGGICIYIPKKDSGAG